MSASGLCWFLILALGVWQLARVMLSPSGQALLAALADKIRGPKPPDSGKE
jgi:hypothetical protein